MARWTDVGHAMRRRMGAPSNHHEAAGNNMNKEHMTPEEVIASAEHANSARRYVGQVTGVADMSATPLRGTLIPKKSVQAGDPTIMNKGNKKNILVNNAAQSERMGARYVIGASFPAVHQSELGANMSNARMIPSVAGRQSPDFNNGINGSY